MDWEEVGQFTVNANPTGLWTLVIDYLEGFERLRFTASGKWSFGAAACGPDGTRLASISREECLLSKAPVGALIGKLGGSTAGIADGYLFVVGSRCTLETVLDDVPDSGPLYLTINDSVEGLDDNSGSLKVIIDEDVAIGAGAR